MVEMNFERNRKCLCWKRIVLISTNSIRDFYLIVKKATFVAKIKNKLSIFVSKKESFLHIYIFQPYSSVRFLLTELLPTKYRLHSQRQAYTKKGNDIAVDLFVHPSTRFWATDAYGIHFNKKRCVEGNPM